MGALVVCCYGNGCVATPLDMADPHFRRRTGFLANERSSDAAQGAISLSALWGGHIDEELAKGAEHEGKNALKAVWRIRAARVLVFTRHGCGGYLGYPYRK